MMNRERYRLLVVWLLRIIGVSVSLAFATIFLPLDWMHRLHAWLGLGTAPEQAIFAYLTRSLSAMYFAHGCVVLLASSDVERFLPLVCLIALLNIVLGVLLLVIDLWAGMPGYWTALEGPPIALMGLVLLWGWNGLRSHGARPS